MKLIETPTVFSTTRVFPSEFEDDPSIFYHGTSELYSSLIESFGLFPNKKPVTEFFYELFSISEKLHFLTTKEHEFSDFNKTFLDVAGYFRDFTRMSFSAISVCAAGYSIGKTAGGQGLRNLKELYKAILNIDPKLLNGYYLPLTENQSYYLTTLRSEFERISHANGIVYAIKFDSNDFVNLDYCNHGHHSVLLTNNHVPPTKFVGKMVIPLDTNIPQTLLDTGNSETIELENYSETNPFIREILEGNKLNLSLIDILTKIKHET